MPRGGPAELIGESATSPPRSSQQAWRRMRKSERASRCLSRLQSDGGQGRDWTADAGLFRALLSCTCNYLHAAV